MPIKSIINLGKKTAEEFRRLAIDTKQEVQNLGKMSPDSFKGLTGRTIEISNKPKPTADPIGIRQVAGVAFGESSPYKPGSEKELEKEMRAVISSALNRAKIIKKPLSEVLQIPEQYQAFGGRQFNKFINSQLEEYGDEPKANILGNIVRELESGSFNPTDYDFTSFEKARRPGSTKIGSHYFFKEDKFRTK